MREPCNAARAFGDHAERQVSLHELQKEPEHDEDAGGDLHEVDEDENRNERDDTGVREQRDVACEHAGDRARGTDHRDHASRVDEHLPSDGA